MTETNDSSHLRATPVQTRSAKTFDLILGAAARILAQEGLPGFNTNAVAKAAGINVATLYHYFPHKNAILREMADRYAAELSARARQYLDALESVDDLGDWLGAAVGEIDRLRRGQPGVAALGRALRVVPELLETRAASDRAWTLDLASALTRRLPGLDAPRASVVAKVMIEAATAVLDLASENPDMAPAILHELATLLGGYFVALGDKGSHGEGSLPN